MKSILYPLKSTSKNRRSTEEIPKGIKFLLKAIEEHHTDYENNQKNNENVYQTQISYEFIYKRRFPDLMEIEEERNKVGYKNFKEKFKVVKEQGLSSTSSRIDTEQYIDKIKPQHDTHAYKRRNVYKSIIRHMAKVIAKNRQYLITVLDSNGFKRNEI